MGDFDMAPIATSTVAPAHQADTTKPKSPNKQLATKAKCDETEYAKNVRGGGYNGGLVEMEDTGYAANSFWKSNHTAFPVDLSDDDECEQPTKQPTNAKTAPKTAPKTTANNACAETEYARNVRGGGYNGGLVEMQETEYAASSFWKSNHTAFPVDLSDEDC